MTYCNVVLRRGYDARGGAARRGGGHRRDRARPRPRGARRVADRSRGPTGIETVLLAAPATPPAAPGRASARGRGIRLRRGPDGDDRGEPSSSTRRASRSSRRSRARTSLPVCLGVGVSTPAQAAEVVRRRRRRRRRRRPIVRRMLEGATRRARSRPSSRRSAPRSSLVSTGPRDHGPVVAAEPEGVRQHDATLERSRHVEHDVEADGRGRRPWCRRSAGSRRSATVSTDTTASMAPAAPRLWPR